MFLVQQNGYQETQKNLGVPDLPPLFRTPSLSRVKATSITDGIHWVVTLLVSIVLDFKQPLPQLLFARIWAG